MITFIKSFVCYRLFKTVVNYASNIQNDYIYETFKKYETIKNYNSQKFISTFWYLCYFLFINILLHNEFYDKELSIVFLGNNQPQQNLIPLYYYSIFYYIEDLTELIIFEEGKDRIIYIFHHFVTLILLFSSFIYNYHNMGMYILYIHNFADLVLKLSKYVKFYSDLIPKDHPNKFIYSSLSDGILGLFGVIFIYTRLVWFYKLVEIIPYEYLHWKIPLVILYFMHIYWSYLIVKFVIKIFIN